MIVARGLGRPGGLAVCVYGRTGTVVPPQPPTRRARRILRTDRSYLLRDEEECLLLGVL